MIPKHYEIRFEPTTLCNYNCTFCGNSTMKRRNKTMSFELFKTLFDRIFNETDQYTTVSFVGIGEPLLDKGLEKKIAYVKKMNPELFVPVTTNGYFLTPSRYKKLVKVGADLIRISLQGGYKEAYAKTTGRQPKYFYKVTHNIQQIREIKEKSIVIITFIFNDILSVDAVIQHKKWWEDRCDILEIWTPHNTGDSFSFRKVQKHKKKTCGLLFNGSLTVYVDGNINICCMDVQGKHVLGNLKKQSLKEMFTSKKYLDIARCHTTGDFKGSKLVCENCDQRNWDKSEALIYSSKFTDYQKRIAKGSAIFSSLTRIKEQ